MISAEHTALARQKDLQPLPRAVAVFPVGMH